MDEEYLITNYRTLNRFRNVLLGSGLVALIGVVGGDIVDNEAIQHFSLGINATAILFYSVFYRSARRKLNQLEEE